MPQLSNSKGESRKEAEGRTLEEHGFTNAPGYKNQYNYIVGASMYGGPSDPTSGTHGYKGDLLTGKSAYAELSMGTALGMLPYKTKLIIRNPKTKKEVIAEKLDIGLGGAPVEGHARRIDLWYQTAQAIGFSGIGLVEVERVDKKPIMGPHDSIAGNQEKGEFLLEPFGGPHSEGAAEAAVNAAKGALSWTSELGKILHFIGSSSGWLRIGKVLVGVILLVIALDELSKIGPGPSVNATGTAKKVAKTGLAAAAL